MPLDPDCVRVLALLRESGLAPVEKLTPAEARSNYRRTRSLLQPPAAEVAEIRDLNAPGPAGPSRFAFTAASAWMRAVRRRRLSTTMVADGSSAIWTRTTGHAAD